MNGGTCGVYLQVQCVHARAVQLALAFRSLSAFASQQRQPGVHSPPRDISIRGASPSLRPTTPISLHLYRLYRAPQGRALIYLKDEVDVGASPPARVTARFSDTSYDFRFDIYSFTLKIVFFFLRLYRLMCANIFLVIFNGPLF